jgi:hypothetical protein
MSKALAASCEGGVVTAGGVAVAGTEVQSEGVGASTGVLILDGEKRYYFPKGTPDLKTTLEQVIAALAQTKTALNQVASALTTIDAKPTGGTGSAVVATVAANVSAINTAATAVDTAKEALNTLKGALR